MCFGFICLFILGVQSVSSSNLQSLIDETKNLYEYQNSDLKDEGIFERFIRRLLELLSSPEFPRKKVKKVVNLMYREIDDIDNKFTRRLAKHFKSLVKMDKDEIKDEVQEYKREYEKKLPQRTAFMKAMNDVFTLREDQFFDDYIYNLKDYGSGDKRSMKDETHQLIPDVILGNIHKMSARDQIDLKKKLRNAIKEYDHDVNGSFEFKPMLKFT